MIFNTNQNRQFYVFNKVITGITATPTNEGEIKVEKGDGQIFFKHYGKGGLTRTDIIDVDKIAYAKLTMATDLARPLNQVTIKLDSNVGINVGEDYILRIEIPNYLAPGDACVLIKSAAVHATGEMQSDDTFKKFFDTLKKSVDNTFVRESGNLIKTEVTTYTETISGENKTKYCLVLTEVPQPWRLGALSQEPVNIKVHFDVVTKLSEEYIWGKAEEGVSTEKIGNGKQLADLEYFCMAERGDMFRNMGWPNNLDVKYMIDPSAEYDVIDIHYAYSGNGVDVHKSEKDLTLVIKKGTNDSTADESMLCVFANALKDATGKNLITVTA